MSHKLQPPVFLPNIDRTNGEAYAEVADLAVDALVMKGTVSSLLHIGETLPDPLPAGPPYLTQLRVLQLHKEVTEPAPGTACPTFAATYVVGQADNPDALHLSEFGSLTKDIPYSLAARNIALDGLSLNSDWVSAPFSFFQI